MKPGDNIYLIVQTWDSYSDYREQIIRLQLGYLDDGCKMFMTSDDAKKVAYLCNGGVERVKFIDE